MAKVLILSNHFITLYAFRKELVQKMVSNGHKVYVSLPEDSDNNYFDDIGCNVIVTNLERRGMNPFKDIKLAIKYYHIMKDLDPDIILSFTIKPNIYGSIASRITHHRQICNITGTGATFLNDGLINVLCKFLYRISVRYCYKVFFQNNGDLSFFVANRLVNNNYVLIPGSGVNIVEHPILELPPMTHIHFIFIGRVMRLKGIDDYLECAKRIHQKYNKTTFYIAGWNEEPEYMKKVESAQNEGYVDYIGFRRDIKEWIQKCHCIIHPAHGGEGMSNVLLECASMGRACIASDISGCREIIDDGITGFIFQEGDVEDLICQVEKYILLSDKDKIRMGENGRKKVVKEFDRNLVVSKYMQEIELLKNE